MIPRLKTYSNGTLVYYSVHYPKLTCGSPRKDDEAIKYLQVRSVDLRNTQEICEDFVHTEGWYYFDIRGADTQ